MFLSFATLAQLAERIIRKDKVRSSILRGGSRGLYNKSAL